MFMSRRKAFTLIEMLIVIVIIGILAAALVPRLQDVQYRARDTKRKADFQQLNSALFIYLPITVIILLLQIRTMHVMDGYSSV